MNRRVGPNVPLMQEILAREAIEALDLPQLNAGSAAQRAGHRRGQHGAAALTPRERQTEQELVLDTPPGALHHLRAAQGRLRSRQRGSADQAAHANSSELDELMMLQHDHNNQSRPIIRAVPRSRFDQPDSGSGRQAPTARRALDGRYDGDENNAGADAGAAAMQTARPALQQLQQVLHGFHAAGVPAYAGLETALLRIHALQGGPAGSLSLSYAVLRVMREHLARGASSVGAPDTLAAVRQRLIELMAARPDGGAPGTPALRRMHLFLPLLLLNAARPRNALARQQGLARLDSLLRRAAPSTR